MRAAVTTARDRGTNIAFLGANAVYRKIRFAASPLGPTGSRSTTRTPPTRSGVPTRPGDHAVAGAAVQRQRELADRHRLRLQPGEGGDGRADPAAGCSPGWDCGPAAGCRGLVGSEYDRVPADRPDPAPDPGADPDSPLVCGGRPDVAEMAYYTTRTGAACLRHRHQRLDPGARTGRTRAYGGWSPRPPAGCCSRSRPGPPAGDTRPGRPPDSADERAGRLDHGLGNSPASAEFLGNRVARAYRAELARSTIAVDRCRAGSCADAGVRRVASGVSLLNEAPMKCAESR